MKYYRIKILPFIFSSFLFSGMSVCADNSKTDTLAVIGKKVLTAEEFIFSYSEKLRNTGLTDNGETRIKYLMNLVNDELLIAEAKVMAAESEKEFKRIKTQELLNAFSLRHISPAINITDDDLKELFTKLNTKIKGGICMPGESSY